MIDSCLEICEGKGGNVYGATDILCALASCGSFVERRGMEVLAVLVESGFIYIFPRKC